jgi:hypothetical protein
MSPVRRLAAAAAACVSVLVAAIPARAVVTPTGRLVYSRTSDAQSCPDEATLRKAVAARVGYDPFFPYAKRTVVTSLARRDGEYVASVELIDEQGLAHGAREIRTSGSCGELLDAAALAIAIAIDPHVLERRASPPPPAAPAPDPSSSAAPSSPPGPPVPPLGGELPAEAEPPRAESPPARSFFEANLGAVASSGIAPSLAAGLDLGGAFRVGILSLGVEGRIDAPASRSAAAGGSVSSWLLLGAVVPCAYFGAFLLCGVLQGGGMNASSDGVPDRRSTWTNAWLAGARAGVLVPVDGRFLFRVRVDALANLAPAALELGGTTLWTAPPVSASLGVDGVLRFP